MPIKKNVIISSVHSEGEKKRQAVEMLAEVSKENNKGEMLNALIYELKPKIEQIIKRVFVKFCNGHGLVEETKVEEEWKYFRKILRKHL